MNPGHVVVIGYGNTLRGDDGVGQEVAKALWSRRDCAGELAHASFTWVVQLVPEMALDLFGSSFAVFVDAAYDANPPGSVKLYDLDCRHTTGDDLAGAADALGCWSDLNPEVLLLLTSELYGHAPQAKMVTVSVGAADVGECLSPPVRAALPEAVDAVRQAIASWRLSPVRDNAGVLDA
jgi:hydrogenase maturation protease